jgi:hypothetical protein
MSAPTLLTPDDAVAQKGSVISEWLVPGDRIRQADIVSLDRKCDACGAPLVCAYADIGVPDSCHTFVHVCLNPNCCLVEEHARFEKYPPPPDTKPPRCPFCFRITHANDP